MNAVNDAPVLSSIGDRQTSEDEPLNILLTAFDVEGDQLSFSVSGGDQITATLSGNELTLTPSQNFYGSESFTVSVSDSELENSETFTVTVNAVNDAPVASDININIESYFSVN